MTPWMEELVARLQETFGARLRFVGLQGSRARGEAGPESDIDAVVILDAVSIQDIRAYRALLETMPEREKVCGFFGAAAELARWDRADLFQFVHDTLSFYDELSALTPPLGREDARRAALKGACDIYHGCMHGLLFDRDPAALRRALQNVGFCAARHVLLANGGVYLPHGRSARRASPRRTHACSTAVEAARALTDDASAFEALSERLLLWSRQRHPRHGRR